MPSSKKSLPGEGGKYFPLGFSGKEVRKWRLFGTECLVPTGEVRHSLEHEWPY